MSRTTPDPPGHAPDEPGDPSRPARRHERRTGWLAGIGLLVLLVGLYGSAVILAGDKIAAGTEVADVGIGGLGQRDAAKRLRTELLPRTDDPIAVSVAGEDTELDPERAGLSVDVEATLDRAAGGSTLDPRTLWDAFFGGDTVAPVVRAEQKKLLRALRTLGRRTAEGTVEPGVTFAGARPVPQRPRAGVELDVGLAAVAVRDAWLVDDRTVELPVDETSPQLGSAELRAAMQRARRIVSGPITLRLPGREVQLAPDRYAPALSLRALDGRIRTVVDRELLTKRLRRVIARAQQPPQDATVRLVGGEPRIVRARAGLKVSPQALSDAVLRAATSSGDRSARLKGSRDRADFTTKDARGLGIRRVIGSFTTSYPHADYRNTNIGRAAELINGTVLRPGETFSLNDTVGERTKANGFAIGFIISNGVYAEDYGGGVSQVATTLFNAAFFAGLEDVEHKPHSFYIDRYPVGREATVAWPSVDLKFRNDSPHGVLVRTWIDPSAPGGSGEMHAQIWSTKRYDIEARQSQRYNYTAPGTRVLTGSDCVPTTGYGGFEIDVFRDFYRPGTERKLRTEKLHTTYTPADTVICR